MIAWWKVKRELNRSKQMLASKFFYLREKAVQKEYDRNRNNLIKVIDGEISLNDKVVLFLIYQPNGVSQSIYRTCKHFVEKGYSPLVVSNAPLENSDLNSLRFLSWRIIERPNYGYDFGGYRDGILWLKETEFYFERLIIINDSIWFPAWPNETLIKSMEENCSDLVGVVFQPPRKNKLFSRGKPGYLESFFYLINQNLLQSDVFFDFWNNYHMSSIKRNAIYRGEKQFSGFFEESGFTVDCIYKLPNLLDGLKDKSIDELVKVISYGAYNHSKLSDERDFILALEKSSDNWRHEALLHIEKVVRKRSLYASFPYASYNFMNVPFIKKNRQIFGRKSNMISQNALRIMILEAIEHGDIDLPYPEVLEEIRAM